MSPEEGRIASLKAPFLTQVNAVQRCTTNAEVEIILTRICIVEEPCDASRHLTISAARTFSTDVIDETTGGAPTGRRLRVLDSADGVENRAHGVGEISCLTLQEHTADTICGNT